MSRNREIISRFGRWLLNLTGGFTVLLCSDLPISKPPENTNRPTAGFEEIRDSKLTILLRNAPPDVLTKMQDQLRQRCVSMSPKSAPQFGIPHFWEAQDGGFKMAP